MIRTISLTIGEETREVGRLVAPCILDLAACAEETVIKSRQNRFDEVSGEGAAQCEFSA